MNLYLDWLWVWQLLDVLECAATNAPTVYSSRIDGCLMVG